MTDEQDLRAEAKRLASLGEDALREEMIYHALIAGKQSQEAGQHLADLDRSMLSQLFRERFDASASSG